MIRLLLLVSLLVAAPAPIFGDELRSSWAQCPLVLLTAQGKANRELDLQLDGNVISSGDVAPRVRYEPKLKHGYLRVSIRVSMKAHELSGWHVPDTDSENRHELQLDGPGLTASIAATDLGSPLVAIFKAALEECMGAKKS